MKNNSLEKHVYINCFYYDRGAGPGCNSQEISDKLCELKGEISNLDAIEKILDQQQLWVQQSLKNVSEDPENERHAYVSHEDVCMCFRGETLLAIQAPSGTQLEVPPPDIVSLIKTNTSNFSKYKFVFINRIKPSTAYN